MTYVRAPALDQHRIDSLNLQEKKRARLLESGAACGNTINGFHYGFECFGFELTRGISTCSYDKNFEHVNHNVNARNSSILRLVSENITSACVLLCVTLPSVSCMPRKAVPMLDQQIYSTFHLTLILI